MFNPMKSLHYATLRKAQDAAVWLNFKHKQDDDFKSLAVLHGANDDFVLLEESEAKEMGIPSLELPTSYTNITYPHIQSIKSDVDPLTHWSEIFGSFSVMKADHLRFILETKLPLEQMVRYELAARGLNKQGKWIGFDQAERYWFGSNFDQL